MVWVNGKVLDTSQPKANDWTPAPSKDRKVWGVCPDCGQDIYELESCWPMVEKTVCVANGCWEKYYEQGLGYHAPAGWGDSVALEG